MSGRQLFSFQIMVFTASRLAHAGEAGATLHRLRKVQADAFQVFRFKFQVGTVAGLTKVRGATSLNRKNTHNTMSEMADLIAGAVTCGLTDFTPPPVERNEQ